jgi:ribosome-binding protein aMBF1 (putative translation factor)
MQIVSEENRKGWDAQCLFCGAAVSGTQAAVLKDSKEILGVVCARCLSLSAEQRAEAADERREELEQAMDALRRFALCASEVEVLTDDR